MYSTTRFLRSLYVAYGANGTPERVILRVHKAKAQLSAFHATLFPNAIINKDAKKQGTHEK